MGGADVGPPSKAAILRGDWLNITDRHIKMTVPKMAEYGSRDLVDIGREILELAGHESASDDQLAYEAVVFFYLRGKVARWAAAVGRGDAVSRDTLDDIIIYATMVLLNREGDENE